MISSNGYPSPLALLITCAVALCACGDGADLPAGEFHCGNGSCLIDSEMCVDGSGCKTCSPLPEPCQGNLTCSCLDEVDLTTLEYPCAGTAECDDTGDGLKIACDPLDWGCG
jgi:hypothetical protein